MSRKLFLVATALFWMAVGVAWLDSRSGSATPVVPPVEVGKRFTLAEVARHATEDDCWMAINGKVYDLSAICRSIRRVRTSFCPGVAGKPRRPTAQR